MARTGISIVIFDGKSNRMKTLTKIGSVIAFAAVIASTSCSVEYKRHHRRHRVIEVGMNEQKSQSTQVLNYSKQNPHNETPVAVK